VLYYVASKAYQDIPETPPAPSMPSQQPLSSLNNSSSSYNLSLVPLVPSEPRRRAPPACAPGVPAACTAARSCPLALCHFIGPDLLPCPRLPLQP
jgi:hypothetical protein